MQSASHLLRRALEVGDVGQRYAPLEGWRPEVDRLRSCRRHQYVGSGRCSESSAPALQAIYKGSTGWMVPELLQARANRHGLAHAARLLCKVSSRARARHYWWILRQSGHEGLGPEGRELGSKKPAAMRMIVRVVTSGAEGASLAISIDAFPTLRTRFLTGRISSEGGDWQRGFVAEMLTQKALLVQNRCKGYRDSVDPCVLWVRAATNTYMQRVATATIACESCSAKHTTIQGDARYSTGIGKSPQHIGCKLTAASINPQTHTVYACARYRIRFLLIWPTTPRRGCVARCNSMRRTAV